VVGILDKYPKSSVHALLLARQPGLDAVSQLTGRELPLLMHMRAVALDYIQRKHTAGLVTQQQQGQGTQGEAAQHADGEGASSPSSSSSSMPPGWQLGFHSLPSMAQLHLHILTDDFNSEWLKTKKHWNSFTSPFFLPLDDVIVTLQQQGSVRVDKAQAEGLLKQGVVCHKCALQLPNMPQLKVHLRGHGSSRPGG